MDRVGGSSSWNPTSGTSASADPAQSIPMHIPMPPGPTVVQVPLFDSMKEILLETRLAQLATVQQQRELMRYLRGLNHWLERDVHDRHSEIRGVATCVEDLRNDLSRLQGPGFRPPAPVLPPQSDMGPPLGFQPYSEQLGTTLPTIPFPVPEEVRTRTPAIPRSDAGPPPGFQPYSEQSGIVPPTIPFPVPEEGINRTPAMPQSDIGPPPGFQPYSEQSGIVPPIIPFPTPGEGRDRTPVVPQSDLGPPPGFQPYSEQSGIVPPIIPFPTPGEGRDRTAVVPQSDVGPPPGFQPYPEQQGVVPPVIPFPIPGEGRDRTPTPPFSPVIPRMGRPGGTPPAFPVLSPGSHPPYQGQ